MVVPDTWIYSYVDTLKLVPFIMAIISYQQTPNSTRRTDIKKSPPPFGIKRFRENQTFIQLVEYNRTKRNR